MFEQVSRWGYGSLAEEQRTRRFGYQGVGLGKDVDVFQGLVLATRNALVEVLGCLLNYMETQEAFVVTWWPHLLVIGG